MSYLYADEIHVWNVPGTAVPTVYYWRDRVLKCSFVSGEFRVQPLQLKGRSDEGDKQRHWEGGLVCALKVQKSRA